jgi:hypothetical protein
MNSDYTEELERLIAETLLPVYKAYYYERNQTPPITSADSLLSIVARYNRQKVPMLCKPYKNYIESSQKL